MIFIWAARYILQEGQRYHPKKVITYYFSPLCKECFKFKKAQDWDPGTAVIFQPVLLDDHDVPLQIFILSLIKKFKLEDFWNMALKFLEQESRHSSREEMAQEMGFSADEINWITQNSDYQRAIEKELRHPVRAYLSKGILKYHVLKDSDIMHVPMLYTQFRRLNY